MQKEVVFIHKKKEIITVSNDPIDRYLKDPNDYNKDDYSELLSYIYCHDIEEKTLFNIVLFLTDYEEKDLYLKYLNCLHEKFPLGNYEYLFAIYYEKIDSKKALDYCKLVLSKKNVGKHKVKICINIAKRIIDKNPELFSKMTDYTLINIEDYFPLNPCNSKRDH